MTFFFNMFDPVTRFALNVVLNRTNSQASANNPGRRGKRCNLASPEPIHELSCGQRSSCRNLKRIGRPKNNSLDRPAQYKLLFPLL